MHIGLTGGIGSGKSTVAAALAGLGAVVVDADAISRSLTATGGDALPALAAAFGPQVIGSDGALDRDAMRAMVFADPAAKRRLESILHPMIGERTRQQADAARGRPVVFDIPLLAESPHWRARVDRVLVIDCREDTQVERVMLRSGWTDDAVRRVIAQQASRHRRRHIADAVIFNDSLSLDALHAAVREVWMHWVRAR